MLFVKKKTQMAENFARQEFTLLNNILQKETRLQIKWTSRDRGVQEYNIIEIMKK